MRRLMRLIPLRLQLMFIIFLVIALFVVMPLKAIAQTVLTAPYVGACPSPVPPAWPTSACKYQFYPTTDNVHVVASVSKTAPLYKHTYAGYVGEKFTGGLVACPKGAALSADKTQCLDAAGKDASGLVTLASLSTFTLASQPPPPPPPPPTDDYTAVTGFVIEHSYDGGTTWDPISTTIGYPQQSVAHCFRVIAKRKDGDGPPLVVCPKPK